MSAVLTLTALLPLAPSYIAHHLADLLEVFSRLAAWRSGNNPTGVCVWCVLGSVTIALCPSIGE